MKFRSKATLPREFQYSDGSIKSVPFMHTKQALKTGYDNELGSQVLILPFEVCNLSLLGRYGTTLVCRLILRA